MFTKKKRSQIMAKVKGKNTRPEKIVRSLLHAMGFRFRLHVTALPGKPDIVLPRYKKIIFVHGCFWHGHRGCKRSARPKTKKRFWNAKLDANIRRDKEHVKRLRNRGWKVRTIWECQTRNIKKLYHTLESFMYRN
ncbi:MAG: very short patch repair endonuclease [Methanobacteriota archaeon]